MVCDRPSDDELEDDLPDNLDAFLGWGGCAVLCRIGSIVDVELVGEAAHDGKTGSAAAILLSPDLVVSPDYRFSLFPDTSTVQGMTRFDYSQIECRVALRCHPITTRFVLLRVWHGPGRSGTDSFDEISPEPLPSFQYFFHTERVTRYTR